MRVGPRHLLIVASLALAGIIGTAALQRGAWGLTLASGSTTLGLLAVLLLSSRGRAIDRRTGLSTTSSPVMGPVETVQEDLPDPLNHGFDIPF
jgi:hypothetical protein